MLLFRVVSVRDAIVRKVRLRKKSGVVPECGARKAEDQALDILVERIYTHTKRNTKSISLRCWRQKFRSERTKIKNKLYAARVWKILIQRLGLGIIILVPWSGQNGSLNDR